MRPQVAQKRPAAGDGPHVGAAASQHDTTLSATPFLSARIDRLLEATTIEIPPSSNVVKWMPLVGGDCRAETHFPVLLLAAVPMVLTHPSFDKGLMEGGEGRAP